MDRTLKDSTDNSPLRHANPTSHNRLSRTKQLQLEFKYKAMNDEMRQLKESGINSKEVVQKSKLLKKKLKHANDLSKTAFETGSQRCIEYDAEYFFNGAEVNDLIVRSLQVDSQVFDVLFFAEKLRTYIAPDSRIRDDDIDSNELKAEDFSELGNKCCHLINSAPILSYLYGAFEPGEIVIPAKQRRIGVRTVFNEPKDAAKKPNSKEGIDESDDLKNGKEVERVYNELKNMYDEEKEPVEFFKAIVKPDSFCETVESIFYSAFLIKEGVVSAKERKVSEDHYEAVIEPKDCDGEEEEDEEDTCNGVQSILSFSENDWKAWKLL